MAEGELARVGSRFWVMLGHDANVEQLDIELEPFLVRHGMIQWYSDVDYD